MCSSPTWWCRTSWHLKPKTHFHQGDADPEECVHCQPGGVRHPDIWNLKLNFTKAMLTPRNVFIANLAVSDILTSETSNSPLPRRCWHQGMCSSPTWRCQTSCYAPSRCPWWWWTCWLTTGRWERIWSVKQFNKTLTLKPLIEKLFEKNTQKEHWMKKLLPCLCQIQ